MFDRAQRRGGYAQADFPPQDIGNERHIAEVGQKPRPRLVIGMAAQIAGLHGLAGQFATADIVSPKDMISPINGARWPGHGPAASFSLVQSGRE
jgi:hypothetical protein